MTRLGSLFGGPVLLAVLLARRPGRLAPVAVAALVVGLAWQVITPVRQTAESLDDPATERSYYEPLVTLARRRAARSASASRSRRRSTTGRRHTSRPASRSHADGCASSTSSATGSSTRASRRTRATAGGCSTKGIRYVAASDARLDYSAQDEDRLVREEPPYLRLRGAPRALAHVRGGGRDADALAGGDRPGEPRGAGRRSRSCSASSGPAASSCGCATRPTGTAEPASAWAGPATGRSCACRGRERCGCEPISALERRGARRAASRAGAERHLRALLRGFLAQFVTRS